MAYDPTAALGSRISSVQNALKASPTAYVPNAAPSPSDLSRESKLEALKNKLKVAQASQASEDWYGPKGKSTAESAAPKPGFVGSVIDKLNVPVYAAAGALESLAGKSDVGFVETVNRNMRQNKELFGDVLNDIGLPHYLAAPAGFALDVGVGAAVDPLALLGSSGSRYSSSLWKAGAGLREAGAAGLGAALKTSALEKASAVARLPFLNRTALAEKVFNASYKSKEAFEDLAKVTFRQSLDIPSLWKGYGPGLGETVEGAVKKYVPGGEKAWDFLIGQPYDWYKDAKTMEFFEKTGVTKEGLTTEEGFEALQRGFRQPSLAEEVASVKREAAESLGIKPPAEAVDLVDDVPVPDRPQIAGLRNVIDDSIEVAKAPSAITRAKGSEDLLNRFLDEYKGFITMNDLIEKANEARALPSSTGSPLVDKAFKAAREMRLGDVPVLGKTLSPKIKDIKYMEKALDAYSKFIFLFTTGKVGLSATSRFNSWLGNPVMAGMEGRDISNPMYYKYVKEAKDLMWGKSKMEIAENLLKNEKMATFARGYPRLFRRIFGFSWSSLDVRNSVSKAIEAAAKGGAEGDAVAAGLSRYVQNRGGKLQEEWEALANMAKNHIDQKEFLEGMEKALSQGKFRPGSMEGGFVNFVTNYAKTHDNALPSAAELPIDYASNFLDASAVVKWKNDVKTAANKGNMAAKLMDWYFNRPMEGFEMVDHSFRFGQFMNDTISGLTAGELEKMRRFYKIGSQDIDQTIRRGGQIYYTLTADKAAEIASGTYMNYSAMPAAIKVLRSLPIVGSPFAAFSYSMLGKTAQTMVLNPTFFSKMQNFVREASLGLAGPQTPMEKEALLGNQAYLNDPWSLRIPRFFSDHPVYLNVRNAAPFLSNILSPNERKWSDSFGEEAGKVLDRLPVMKDPMGAMLMSYFVLPQFLDDGEVPQNIFGTPLYPKNTGTLGKLGYAGRDLAESVVPSLAGLAALPVHMVGPEAAREQSFIQNVPSYQYRSLANALQGLSSIGAGTKTSIDNPAEKGALKLFSTLTGASLNPVYPTSKTKK